MMEEEEEEEEDEEAAAANHSAVVVPEPLHTLKLSPSLPSFFPFSPASSSPPPPPPQEQFEFALTAVAEEVNAILKALPQ